MRGFVVLLSLLAVARTSHAELVTLRHQEASDVPGLHKETLLLVDDSNEARGEDGQVAVRGIARHWDFSGSSAQAEDALTAIFANERSSEFRRGSWMGQQLTMMESLHQSMLPHYQSAAAAEHGIMIPMRHQLGCRKHLLPGATAQAFASPVVLRQMALSRLPPQLLAHLLAASSEAASMPQAIYLGGSPPKEHLFLDGSSPERSAGSSMGFRGRASIGSGEQLFGSWEAAAQVADAPSRYEALPTMDLFDSEGQAKQGLVLFVLLCVACAVVWMRLAILACAVRRASTKCTRSRCRLTARHGKGEELEQPLLEPLATEAASTEALGIYSNALYGAPHGKHHAPLGFHPYEVQVAADHADSSAPHGRVVSIQYMPLKSETGVSGL